MIDRVRGARETWRASGGEGVNIDGCALRRSFLPLRLWPSSQRF